MDDLNSALNVLEPAATSKDIGKTLIAKTVADGKVTEYELGFAESLGSVTIGTNESITLEENIKSQDAAAIWVLDGGKDGNDFTNLARNSSSGVPMTLNKSGYNQIASLFADAISTAYGLGDSYIFFAYYLEITGTATFATNSASVETIDSAGNNVTSISQSGWYYARSGLLTGATASINKYRLDGNSNNTGTGKITKLYCQSRTWLINNYSEFEGISGHEFMSKFKQMFPELDLVPGEDYIAPMVGKASATVTINGTSIVYDDSDDTIPIVGGARIAVTKGTLTLTIAGINNMDAIFHGCDARYIRKIDWSSLKWAVVGDSLTDTTINATRKYETIIHRLTGIQVQMLGVGSTGYTAGYEQNKTFRDRILTIDIDTDIVTIFGSVNDWKNNPYNALCHEIGTVSDVYDDSKTVIENTFCANLNHTFDALFARAPAAQVIVFSAMPYYGVNQAYFTNVRNALKAVCEYRHIPYIDMYDSTGFYRIMNVVPYALEYTYEGNSASWKTTSDYSGTFGHPSNLAHEKIIAPKFLEELKRWIATI